MREVCFALLDDAGGLSRRYTDLAHDMSCADPAALDTFWQEVERLQRGGLHALVLADYEWGVRLQGVACRHQAAGVLRVLLFHQLEHLPASEVADWLAACEGGAAAGAVAIRALQADVDDEAFDAAIARIQSAIYAGESYQVNFTYRLNGHLGGSPLSLYRRLRARQPVAYGAFIQLPVAGGETDGITHVLSFSPELFLRHQQGKLTARPMKGTAARNSDVAMDLLAREQLATAKSRAENLMIVDLLRNDLGRVARIGSVGVPALFEVEAHPTVWQMTSSITAQIRPQTRFPDLLRALFPCGSITGAPKHHTLELIDALETTPRGIYCGAIGWIDAPTGDAGCGDFCLSVPIRTLTLGPAEAGWRPLQLGIGAGIVADSEARQERAECVLKARFLTGMDGGFALIETLRIEDGVLPHLTRHVRRLSASADALGVPCDPREVTAALTRRAAELAPGIHRLRLLLDGEGRIQLEAASREDNPVEPVRLSIASEPLAIDAWPMRHKTTLRAPYERALRDAMTQGVFDVLHYNARDEITEGARSNVFVRIDGQWLTPPLACGVLPGVMRSLLLDDPAWAAREAVITRRQLLAADEIVVCNALRGVLRAQLV